MGRVLCYVCRMAAETNRKDAATMTTSNVAAAEILRQSEAGNLHGVIASLAAEGFTMSYGRGNSPEGRDIPVVVCRIYADGFTHVASGVSVAVTIATMRAVDALVSWIANSIDLDKSTEL